MSFYVPLVLWAAWDAPWYIWTMGVLLLVIDVITEEPKK